MLSPVAIDLGDPMLDIDFEVLIWFMLMSISSVNKLNQID